eukprot:COSAG02_NODE_1126_length_14431_cov_37.854452_24_plen_373_part_00
MRVRARLAGLLDHLSLTHSPSVSCSAAGAVTTELLDETIALSIPPRGVDLAEDEQAVLRARCAAVEARLKAFQEHDLHADIAIVPKAIKLALKYHEFYDQRPVVQRWIDTNIEGPSGKALTPERKAELEAMIAKMPSATASADDCLAMAEARLTELETNVQSVSWTAGTAAASAPYSHGCVVRGYTSVVDGSPQPYGLELPPELPPHGQTVPLYVWLHGRGAQSTDIHFIRERMRSRGNMSPSDGGIVLHPFGRQCIGYKSAGAIDVLHAIEDVKAKYPIDPDRVVLYTLRRKRSDSRLSASCLVRTKRVECAAIAGTAFPWVVQDRGRLVHTIRGSGLQCSRVLDLPRPTTSMMTSLAHRMGPQGNSGNLP